MDLSVLVPVPSRESGSVEPDTETVIPLCDKVAGIQEDIDGEEAMGESARLA